MLVRLEVTLIPATCCRGCECGSAPRVLARTLQVLHGSYVLSASHSGPPSIHAQDVSTERIFHDAGIRDHVVQAVELKFNCFFLMPVVDAFPTRLREELEAAYEEDIDEVFDVAAVRNALDLRLKSLESELHQVGLLAGQPLPAVKEIFQCQSDAANTHIMHI